MVPQVDLLVARAPISSLWCCRVCIPHCFKNFCFTCIHMPLAANCMLILCLFDKQVCIIRLCFIFLFQVVVVLVSDRSGCESLH